MADSSTAMVSDILDLVVPTTIKVSPDGAHVIYSTRLKWNHRKGEHTLASIWIAKTDVPQSAHRLTDGTYNDRNPQWAPDSQSVAFVSDRGGQGKACAIYVLKLDDQVPKVVTPSDMRQITKFAFSPDGCCIAFVALPEKSAEQKTTDVNVWGQNWEFARLWLLNLETGTVEALSGEDAHVVDFVWTDCDTEIALMTHRTPHIESKYLHGTTISILQVEDRKTRKICNIPGGAFDPVWLNSTLYFLSNNILGQESSGWGVYCVGEKEPCQKVAHGEVDCATGLARAGNDIVVHVEHGPEDWLRLLRSDRTLLRQRKRIVAFDVSCGGDGEMRLAVTQGDVNRPTEVFCVNPTTGAAVPLSDHGAAFSNRMFGHCAFVKCQTLDDKELLDGVYLIPAQYTDVDGKPTKPLPTLVIAHGGPYTRLTDAFDFFDPFYLVIQPLLAEGYGILVPNYRGSSGRGERFASYARGDVGLYDEPDIVAMVQNAVMLGYADKSRLMIAGWSQGGHLSFLSAVRNGIHGFGWRFRGAIAGAGITDWDSMALMSDVGYMQAQTAGGAPWNMDKTDVKARRGSALWEFKEAAREGRIPPMLILHGEKDERVPVAQAWGFRRAMDEAGLPFEFVTYPREGHYFREEKHVVDLLMRILRFVREYLS
ncbi:Alpha/Beta hydrolase protein [Echria macrotheca]|uniref:Dipeptidyl-peptidase V n=1 Tax=Echria macrotheca TaxID=438768 RepID=A0AAJ0BP48_9PEZI|nr:Alpha/Beta hydrolase protein [Echria macrotheca]